MKTSLCAVALAAFFGIGNAIADDSTSDKIDKTMCAEDCPAYVASPNKDTMSLADILQLCSKGDKSIRIVADCQSDNDE